MADSDGSGDTLRPAVDWAEVRRAYEITGMPAGEVRRRFGLTKAQLRGRREREGWIARAAAREGRP
jgi:hypothetical protein